MRRLLFGKAGWLVAALLLAALPLAAGSARAQTALLYVWPETVLPGEYVTATGYGFAASEEVLLESQLYGIVVDTYSVFADENGSFSVTRQVPAYAPSGLTITVVATGLSSGLVASATVYIGGSSDGMGESVTGSNGAAREGAPAGGTEGDASGGATQGGAE
jgi:hypothetical protein